MVQPFAVCLESLDGPKGHVRHLACTALVGPAPGLALSEAGEVSWCESVSAVSFWVSADSRLVLVRESGAPEVQVERAGRSLSVPWHKPVVLANADVVSTARRRYRVHLHGPAASITPPTAVSYHDASSLRSVAAAVALGVVGLGCCKGMMPGGDRDAAQPDASQGIEVREHPPAPPSMPRRTNATRLGGDTTEVDPWKLPSAVEACALTAPMPLDGGVLEAKVVVKVDAAGKVTAVQVTAAGGPLAKEFVSSVEGVFRQVRYNALESGTKGTVQYSLFVAPQPQFY
jgi:hypothetical protein